MSLKDDAWREAERDARESAESEPLTCNHCGAVITNDNGGAVSTYCGSMCQGCVEGHKAGCQTCAAEAWF